MSQICAAASCREPSIGGRPSRIPSLSTPLRSVSMKQLRTILPRRLGSAMKTPHGGSWARQMGAVDVTGARTGEELLETAGRLP
jgi:hypothetical protein